MTSSSSFKIEFHMEKLILTEDAPIDTAVDNFYVSGLFSIESSPAFKALDAYQRKQGISEEQISQYKTHFLNAYNYLLGVSGFQKEMTKKLKASMDQIIVQRQEKDKRITKMFSETTEVGESRRDLLKVQNEVNLALDREHQLSSNIDGITQQKDDLIKDIEAIRKYKADLFEPQLISSTKELKNELLQRKGQVANLQTDMDEKQAIFDTVIMKRDLIEEQRNKHSLLLAKASETPIKLLKQSDILIDALNSLDQENSKQVALSSSLDREIERLTQKKKDQENLKQLYYQDYEQRQEGIFEMEQQTNAIFNEHELANDQIEFQKAEKIRIITAIKRTVHDVLKLLILDKTGTRISSEIYKGQGFVRRGS